MAFLPIYFALQNSRRRGPMREPSGSELIVIILLTLVAVAVLIVISVVAARSQQDFEAHQKPVYQAWDAGMGRPEAAQVTSANVVAVPNHTNTNQYWNTCNSKTCRHKDVAHYPMVYPVKSLHFGDDSCYVGTSDTRPAEIMAASQGAGVYRVGWDAAQGKLHICAPSNRSGNDKVTVWSDEVPK